MTDLAHKMVLVLGLGESGSAIARWCLAEGARLRIADSRAAGAIAAPHGLEDIEIHWGGFALELLEGADLVAISPGLALHHEPQATLLATARERGIPIWGEIEFFARKLVQLREQRDYRPRVIGITGTNGKTTVTSLTTKLCQRAGLSALAAGNISPAALAALSVALKNDALPDVWVLELSSFQLATTFGLVLDAAVVLNVSQDHLDWHGAMVDYAAAKARIYTHATVCVVNRDDARVMAMLPPAQRALASSFGLDAPLSAESFGLVQEAGMRWLAFAEPLEEDGTLNKKQRKLLEGETVVKRLMPTDALRIRGTHNVANALAALALCRAINLPLAPVLHALRDYRGEAHRVQLVRSFEGVEYFDDSKGTNVGATVAALDGLGRCVVLIAGGDGKGQDFAPLLRPVTEHARAVVLIGKDAPAIRSALDAAQASGRVTLVDATTLEQAVEVATTLAQPGDAVLLSPACASLDMFSNYRHRAEVFIDAVNALVVPEEAAC